MLPTLRPGQDVLAWCWFNKYKTGDIVIVHRAKRRVQSEIVKRVQNVKNGKVYLIGDNTEESTDSRNFGAVKKSEIIGKVIIVVR